MGDMAVLRGFISLLLLVGSMTAGYGQSLQEVENAQAALIAAWEKTPLTMRRALFVAKKAQGFGQFEERSSNVFKAGEPLVAYAEPVGYGWEDVGNGLFGFGFAGGFLVKAPGGKIFGGEPGFFPLPGGRPGRQLRVFVLPALHR